MKPALSRPVPCPGYVARRPQYQAYKRLRFVAGLQDTLINLNEVALRYLERDIKQQADQRRFIDDTSHNLGVNTSLGAPWSEVQLNARRYAVAQAYAVFDSFCRRLASEFRQFTGITNWKSHDGDRALDALSALTANMQPMDRKRARECPEYDLIHYYRVIRNRLLHATDDDTDSLLASLLERHSEHLTKAYDALPKSFASIDYADYAILTRAMKYYSAVLNDGCALTPALVVARLLKDPAFVADLRRRKGDNAKLGTLARRVAARYAVSSSDVLEIRGAFDAFVLTDPSHSQRRAAARKKR